MADIMIKADNLLEAIEQAGIKFTEGQTAIVCNDGVAVITVGEGSKTFDLLLCNNKVDLNYNMGITAEDVKDFKTVAGIATEMGL